MSIEDRIISKKDLFDFKEGKDNVKINKIWQEILNDLPEKLKKEAINKGFNLTEIDRSMELINLIIEIPKASQSLELALVNLNPFIICE